MREARMLSKDMSTGRRGIVQIQIGQYGDDLLVFSYKGTNPAQAVRSSEAIVGKPVNKIIDLHGSSFPHPKKYVKVLDIPSIAPSTVQTPQAEKRTAQSSQIKTGFTFSPVVRTASSPSRAKIFLYENERGASR